MKKEVSVSATAAVIAEIVREPDGANGHHHPKNFVVVKTPDGIRFCKEEDLGFFLNWRTLHDSLQNFVGQLNGGPGIAVIRAASNPNDPNPVMDLEFKGFRPFKQSGFDYRGVRNGQVLVSNIAVTV